MQHALGPTLFNLCTNSLLSELSTNLLVAYPEDITLKGSETTPTESNQQHTQHLLHILLERESLHQLVIDTNNSYYMLMLTSQCTIIPPCIPDIKVQLSVMKTAPVFKKR